MNTKLTLHIEKKIVDSAHEYADEKGQKLSEIVENYLKLIISERPKIKVEELSQSVKRLRGVIKTKDNLNTSIIVEEELLKKYDR